MRSTRNLRATQLMKAHALLMCLTFCGCEADLRSPNSGVGALEFPSRMDFPKVADAMQVRCGTLDCHGQIGRNLRLYGHYGMRLDKDASPLDPFDTSEAEYDASYASVTGLEPEAMSQVVRGLETPVSLAFVRKPRGLEKHKGFQLMNKGDDLDRCLVGWLIAEFDEDACNTVIFNPHPEPDGGPPE